jgi:hypothetical protein
MTLSMHTVLITISNRESLGKFIFYDSVSSWGYKESVVSCYSGRSSMGEDTGKRGQPARNSKSRRSRRMRRFESKKHKK